MRNIFKCPVMDIQQITHPPLLWQAAKSKTVQAVLIAVMTTLEPRSFELVAQSLHDLEARNAKCFHKNTLKTVNTEA